MCMHTPAYSASNKTFSSYQTIILIIFTHKIIIIVRHLLYISVKSRLFYFRILFYMKLINFGYSLKFSTIFRLKIYCSTNKKLFFSAVKLYGCQMGSQKLLDGVAVKCKNTRKENCYRNCKDIFITTFSLLLILYTIYTVY